MQGLFRPAHCAGGEGGCARQSSAVVLRLHAVPNLTTYGCRCPPVSCHAVVLLHAKAAKLVLSPNHCCHAPQPLCRVPPSTTVPHGALTWSSTSLGRCSRAKRWAPRCGQMDGCPRAGRLHLRLLRQLHFGNLRPHRRLRCDVLRYMYARCAANDWKQQL